MFGKSQFIKLKFIDIKKSQSLPSPTGKCCVPKTAIVF